MTFKCKAEAIQQPHSMKPEDFIGYLDDIAEEDGDD